MKSLNRTSPILCALALGFASQSSFSADWPQFRGPERSYASEETGLLQEWPESGPRQVWLSKDAGLGYSGPAIVGGKLFIMGSEGDKEFLVCLDEKSGKKLWASTIGAFLQNDWGDGPRSTPAVDGDRVYVLTGQGQVACVSAADGSIKWTQSLQDLGGSIPKWGYAESLLVDGDLVLCTPGGSKGTMAALNKMTGKQVWQSKDWTDEAQYASIIPATIHGEKQYIQLTQQTLAGISAKNGSVLWRTDWQGKTAVIPTPIVHENYVYICSGYGVGEALVKIDPGQKVSDVYRSKVMKNQHGGVIQVGNHLYGYSDAVGWVCQDLMTGEKVWAERAALQKGAIGYADGKLYCLEEGTGTIALIDASPEGYKERGRFTMSPLSEQRASKGKIWVHPVVANGKLYLRDQELLFAFDVSK